MEGEGDSPTETVHFFVCTVCEKVFKQKKSLDRHLRSYHNIEPLSKKEPQFECETCEKIYKQKKSLNKHLRSYHNIEPLRKKEPQFECETCEKKFTQKGSLYKHLRIYHNIEPLSKKEFECETCEKKFKQKRSLYKHLRSYHNIEPMSKKEFECETCEKKFSIRSNLKHHAEKFHGHVTDSRLKTRLICGFQECDLEFMNQKQYRIHLQKDHKLNLETEEFCFGSIQKFQHWKKAMESQSLAFYAQDTAKKTLANGNIKIIYNCHRSIKYISKKRAARSMASNKINKACPARLDVKVVNDKSKVIVKFYKTHCGHETQIGRNMLDKNTKAQIADKHKEGVTFKHILDSVQIQNTENHKVNYENELLQTVCVKPTPSYTISGKECINKKIVSIMELLRTTDLDNEDTNIIENKLDQVIDILNKKKKNFSEVEHINIKKYIKKRLLLPKRNPIKNLFSTKKKTVKMNNFKKPSIFEQGAIKTGLNNLGGEAVDVNTDVPHFDHIYIFEF